jgi:hypothetical protein
MNILGHNMEQGEDKKNPVVYMIERNEGSNLGKSRLLKLAR